MSISRFQDISVFDLTRLEEEDGDLSKVEVDEMLGLVGDVRAEVSAGDAVPSWVVLLVELFLDERGNVLLDVVLLNSLCCDVDGVLLHVSDMSAFLTMALRVSDMLAARVSID